MLNNNDPLLSGIIDVVNLHPDIIKRLQLSNLWREVNENFDIISPPNDLLEEEKGRYGIPMKFFGDDHLL